MFRPKIGLDFRIKYIKSTHRDPQWIPLEGSWSLSSPEGLGDRRSRRRSNPLGRTKYGVDFTTSFSAQVLCVGQFKKHLNLIRETRNWTVNTDHYGEIFSKLFKNKTPTSLKEVESWFRLRYTIMSATPICMVMICFTIKPYESGNKNGTVQYGYS